VLTVSAHHDAPRKVVDIAYLLAVEAQQATGARALNGQRVKIRASVSFFYGRFRTE
jgi:hypothetical protein